MLYQLISNLQCQRVYNIYQKIISLSMSESLEKQIITRVRRIKCSQPQCRSNNQQTLQIAVIGNTLTKRKGIMCTSCFIDEQLIKNLGNVQLNALSIQKFLKALTQSYSVYAQQKAKPDWAPNKLDSQRQEIRKKIIQLEKNVTRAVLDIMKFLDDAIKQASQNAKKTNQDKSLQKLLQLITQQNQNQQQRINVQNQLKDLTSKLIKDHGQYKLNTDDQVKKNNEMIMIQFKKKASKSKQAIIRLVQVHKKCLKYLID